jgi:hypothetical protein
MSVQVYRQPVVRRNGSAASWVLLLLAGVTVGAVVYKAMDLGRPEQVTPRDLAEAFLAEARPASSGDASSASGALFTDVAPEAGIVFTHDNAARGNYLLPEQIGPGAGFVDHDDDGDLDIFIAGGGAIIDDGPAQTSRLYRNDGGRFTDVTEEAGAGVTGPGTGVACADFDDGGGEDLYVCRLGPNALLVNDGAGRFTESAVAAGVAEDGFGASATFFDYDRDGALDLYVTNYVGWSMARETQCFSILGTRDYCNPGTYEAPAQDRLFRNRGDGTFEDATESAGIAGERGQALGVIASDFDSDGWPDLYVANDQTPGFLWHNNGDGTFENMAVLAGCAYDGRGAAIAGMGVVGEDLDADGDTDILVTNIRDQYHLVLINDAGSFTDRSLAMGVGAWSVPYTGFGVALFDQDHDGALDGFIANGDVNVGASVSTFDNPYAQADHFVRLVDGVFEDRSAGSGASFGDVGQAVACGDYDGDGDLDLVVTNNGGPVRLLRNDGGGGAWLQVDVRTGPGNRTAIGARVTVECGGRTRVREVRRQQSYLASGDGRVHFGLGAATEADRITVVWLDGTEAARAAVSANQVVRFDRGADGS